MEMAPIRMANNANEMKAAIVAVLNLDSDDPANKVITHNLTNNGRHNEPFTVLFGRHSLQITGRHEQESQHEGQRHQGQDGGGQSAVCAGRFYLAPQPEPLANHVRETSQDLA